MKWKKKQHRNEDELWITERAHVSLPFWMYGWVKYVRVARINAMKITKQQMSTTETEILSCMWNNSLKNKFVQNSENMKWNEMKKNNNNTTEKSKRNNRKQRKINMEKAHTALLYILYDLVYLMAEPKQSAFCVYVWQCRMYIYMYVERIWHIYRE